MKKIKIGIIDTGVDETMLAAPLQHNLYIDDHGACIRMKGGAGVQNPAFMHGTICALILQKHFPNGAFTSIKVLDDAGAGCLDKIEPALEWCFQNQILLVNLSLGTTHFLDKIKLRRIINRYANLGMLLIAASSNSTAVSYPAAFANVVGVTAGDVLCAGGLPHQKGIDWTAPAGLVVESRNGLIPAGRSNSYAAPYITALAAKILSAHPAIPIFPLKESLLRLHCREPYQADSPYYAPDWISAAWIDDAGQIDKSFAYFQLYSGELSQHCGQVDTILFYDASRLEQYVRTGKHLLYLGGEEIPREIIGRFYWDKNRKKNQILHAMKRNAELEIPVIACTTDWDGGLPSLLAGIQRAFMQEGRNLYAYSSSIEGVLYDLDYIPHEIQAEDVLYYLCWQTDACHADALLTGMHSRHVRTYIRQYGHPDILLKLCRNQDAYVYEINCDGQKRKAGSLLPKGSLRPIDYAVLCREIVSVFEEEGCCG